MPAALSCGFWGISCRRYTTHSTAVRSCRRKKRPHRQFETSRLPVQSLYAFSFVNRFSTYLINLMLLFTAVVNLPRMTGQNMVTDSAEPAGIYSASADRDPAYRLPCFFPLPFPWPLSWLHQQPPLPYAGWHTRTESSHSSA